jgi:tetratricopeptide (TPR) repeat protein
VDSRRAQIGSPSSGSKPRLTERFDEALQHGFEWVLANSRLVVAGLIGALVVGGLAAGIYEWVESRSVKGFDELARVQLSLDKALQLEASSLGAGTDTANPELATKLREDAIAGAKKAREDALVGFDTVMNEHAGSLAGTAAGLSAAQLEIKDGKLPAADQRLEKLAAGAPDAVSRAAVLRLRGYVLEETDRADQAADLYFQIGGIEEYPGRIQAYVQAAETYDRLGKTDKAVKSLEELNLIAPDYAERADILPWLETLRARLARETEAKPAEKSAE